MVGSVSGNSGKVQSNKLQKQNKERVKVIQKQIADLKKQVVDIKKSELPKDLKDAKVKEVESQIQIMQEELTKAQHTPVARNEGDSKNTASNKTETNKTESKDSISISGDVIKSITDSSTSLKAAEVPMKEYNAQKNKNKGSGDISGMNRALAYVIPKLEEAQGTNAKKDSSPIANDAQKDDKYFKEVENYKEVSGQKEEEKKGEKIDELV